MQSSRIGVTKIRKCANPQSRGCANPQKRKSAE